MGARKSKADLGQRKSKEGKPSFAFSLGVPDDHRAERVIEFIEHLIVPSGVGQGQPFRLRKWQKEFLRDVYSPRTTEGTRAVRRAILSMGRKNGKTALSAALALVHLVGPEAVPNSEIYSA